VATDAGQPRRSAASLLDVEVLDVDDELPRFSDSEYYFRIAENLPIGTVVGRVEAFDRDANPDFRQVFYFADADDERISEFLSLDSRTGEIRTAVALDREQISSLRLRVFASSAAADQPEVTSSSHCDVIVGVADENDNTPVFVFPNDDNYTVFVNPEVVADGRLVRLNASDRDDGINADLTFFIDGEDRHLGLDVESTSGLLNDDYYWPAYT